MPTYVTDRGTIQVPDGWTLEQFWALSNPTGAPVPKVLSVSPGTSYQSAPGTTYPQPVYPGTSIPAIPGVPYAEAVKREQASQTAASLGQAAPWLVAVGIALMAFLLLTRTGDAPHTTRARALKV